MPIPHVQLWRMLHSTDADQIPSQGCAASHSVPTQTTRLPADDCLDVLANCIILIKSSGMNWACLFTLAGEEEQEDTWEELESLVAVLGPPPPSLLEHGKNSSRFFTEEGRLIVSNSDDHLLALGKLLRL